MKKILSLMLSMVMVICVFATAANAQTTDTVSLADVSLTGAKLHELDGWTVVTGEGNGEYQYGTTWSVTKENSTSSNMVVKVEKTITEASSQRYVAVRSFDKPLTGKVRISAKVYPEDIQTMSCDIRPISDEVGFNNSFGNGNKVEYFGSNNEMRFYIYNGGISFYGKTPINMEKKWYTISYEINTADKTYSMYLGNTALATNQTYTETYNLIGLGFTISRTDSKTGSILFDDVKVETYNDNVDESYYENEANWSTVLEDNFTADPGTELTTYDSTYLKNRGGGDKNVYTANVMQTTIDEDVIDSNNTVFKFEKPQAVSGQNLYVIKPTGRDYTGRVRIKLRAYEDVTETKLPFYIIAAIGCTAGDCSYYNTQPNMLAAVSLQNGTMSDYVKTTKDGNGKPYSASYTEGKWNDIVLDINTENNTFNASIAGRKLIEDGALSSNVANHTHTTSGSGLERIVFTTSREAYTAESIYYVDDLLVQVPNYWTTTYTDNIDDNAQNCKSLTIAEANVSGLSGNGLVVLTADDTKAIKLSASGDNAKLDFSEAKNGIVTAETRLFAADGYGDLHINLLDKNNTQLANVILDTLTLKSLYDMKTKRLSSDDSTDIYEWNSNFVVNNIYPVGEWFTLKIVADTTDRCFDVYINNVKKNISPLPFYNTVEPVGKDTGVAKSLNIKIDGLKSAWYISEMSAANENKAYDFAVKKIGFSDGKYIPANNAKITKLFVNNTTDSSAKAIVSSYNSDGTLCGVDTADIAAKGVSEHSIDVKLPSTDADKAKVSAFIIDSLQKLNPLQTKWNFGEQGKPTVFLCGDSLVQSYTATDYPMQGWGMAIREIFDDSKIKIDNRAMGGRTAQSFIDEKRLEAIEKEIKPGDFILVQFMTNDSSQSFSETDYKKALKNYADIAKAHGATAIYVTSPTRLRDYALDVNPLDNYAQWMKEVANEKSCNVIDLLSSTKTYLSSLPTDASRQELYVYVADNAQYDDVRWTVSKFNSACANYVSDANRQDYTHTTEKGARLLAAEIANQINTNNMPLKAYLRNN